MKSLRVGVEWCENRDNLVLEGSKFQDGLPAALLTQWKIPLRLGQAALLPSLVPCSSEPEGATQQEKKQDEEIPADALVGCCNGRTMLIQKTAMRRSTTEMNAGCLRGTTVDTSILPPFELKLHDYSRPKSQQQIVDLHNIEA